MVVFLKDVATGFIGQPLSPGPGWTWTLTSRLGALLTEAETRYGPRDHSYTILGVEFGGNRPGTWYPGNCKHISVRLSVNAAHDPNRAYFQLAHEVVHLLSPTGTTGTIVLEEGLAHHFSNVMSKQLGISMGCDIPAYDRAAELLETVLGPNPNVILRMRKLEPCLAKITPAIIQACCPNVEATIASQLCEPFALFEERNNLHSS
jgi:hypothetical protein